MAKKLRILTKSKGKYRIKFESDPAIYATNREGLIYYQNHEGYILTGLKVFIDPIEWAFNI